MQPRFDRLEQKISNRISRDTSGQRSQRGDGCETPRPGAMRDAHWREHDIGWNRKKRRLGETQDTEIAFGVPQDTIIQGPKQSHRQSGFQLTELRCNSITNILFYLLFPFDKGNKTDATQRQLLEMIGAPQDHRQLLGTGRTDRHDQPATRRELFEQLLR